MLFVFLMGEKCRGKVEFEVSAEHGLRYDEVPSRRRVYGWNELENHSELSRTEFALPIKV